jgi:tRNA G18 (ribose-2'-O)-methylase SpoU
LTHIKTIPEFIYEVSNIGYSLVALECNVRIPNVLIHNLFEFKWPQNPIIIVGEEQCGLPDEIIEHCSYVVEIPAFGTVRSMNVGTASGIAMSHYRSQHLL